MKRIGFASVCFQSIHPFPPLALSSVPVTKEDLCGQKSIRLKFPTFCPYDRVYRDRMGRYLTAVLSAL